MFGGFKVQTRQEKEERLKGMGEVVLLIQELESNSKCRICHEHDFATCKSLEAPCACSGTIKFAHRDCIQRWCNEKGNTICEICLQKYEPGYLQSVKKSQIIETEVTIRDDLEIPAQDLVRLTNNNIVCTYVVESRTSRYRSFALTCCTILLLVKHLLDLFDGQTERYQFTLFTLIIIKCSGILVPMYLLIQITTAIRNYIMSS